LKTGYVIYDYIRCNQVTPDSYELWVMSYEYLCGSYAYNRYRILAASSTEGLITHNP